MPRVRGKIRLLSDARPDSSKPLPPARGFDVFCLPIIDWGFRVQRPQQLLKPFAADGHRVFYAKTGFLGLDREPEISEVGERIWEVSLPGEHDFDLYARSLAGETLEQALTAILELSERPPDPGCRSARPVSVLGAARPARRRRPRLAARLRLHGRAHGLRHPRPRDGGRRGAADSRGGSGPRHLPQARETCGRAAPRRSAPAECGRRAPLRAAAVARREPDRPPASPRDRLLRSHLRVVRRGSGARSGDAPPRLVLRARRRHAGSRDLRARRARERPPDR